VYSLERANGVRGHGAQGQAGAAYAYGWRLAAAGIGHRATLALVDALHRICWESADRGSGGSPASVRYSNPLLAVYKATREVSLLREQERTRLAIGRARAQNAY